MSDHMQPKKRRPYSSFFVSDDLIRDAKLTREQECLIRIRLLQRKLLEIRGCIEETAETLRSLRTPEGIEDERARLRALRDEAVENLERLDTPDGIMKTIIVHAAVMRRYKRRYEELNTEFHKFMNPMEEQDGGGKHV